MKLCSSQENYENLYPFVTSDTMLGGYIWQKETWQVKATRVNQRADESHGRAQAFIGGNTEKTIKFSASLCNYNVDTGEIDFDGIGTTSLIFQTNGQITPAISTVYNYGYFTTESISSKSGSTTGYTASSPNVLYIRKGTFSLKNNNIWIQVGYYDDADEKYWFDYCTFTPTLTTKELIQVESPNAFSTTRKIACTFNNSTTTKILYTYVGKSSELLKILNFVNSKT